MVTGYEKALAHHTSSEFAYPALEDGTVDWVDPETKVMQVTYASGKTDVVKFGTKYAPVSGSYVEQEIVLNVKDKQQFKKSDILAYNSGFFEPDFGTSQVMWKIGVMANVALYEKDGTYEDSSEISKDLSQRLLTATAESRLIKFDVNTNIRSMVSIGDHVEVTDPLCIHEPGDVAELSESGTDGDPFATFLQGLDRSAPAAEFHGTIAEIHFIYCSDPKKLHPSLVKIVKRMAEENLKVAKQLHETRLANSFLHVQKVPQGTMFKGHKFQEGDAAFLIIIRHDLDVNGGDKIVFASANKSIVRDVFEKPQYTASGLEIDAMLGAISIDNRIVNAPYILGMGERVMEKVEKAFLDAYFE